MPLIRNSDPADRAPAGGSPSALRDGDADARWAAARALTSPADAPVLGAALHAEHDPSVRDAILNALARIGTPDSAHAIIPHLRSDEAALRTAALDSLRTMPDAVAAALPGLLLDPDCDVRLLACELARALPGAGAARLLCDLIERDPEANVCAAAIEVLAEVGGPESVPALAACAARFPGEPFLTFSIEVASRRIGAQAADPLD